jgi:hypothetical protein
MKVLTDFALKRTDLQATAKGLAQNMLSDFEMRWQCPTELKFHDVPKRGSGNRIIGVHPICFIANLLDPRFKLKGLQLSIADCKAIKEKVLEMMKTIYEKKSTNSSRA